MEGKVLGMYSRPTKFFGSFSCSANSKPTERLNWFTIRKEEGYFPPEMEVKFAKDSLDEEQLNDRVKLPLTGVDVYFSGVESNIAFKEEFLGAEKDLEDARHLRIIYKGKLNERKIEEIKNKIRRRNERQKPRAGD
jgi:hypothetical protein